MYIHINKTINNIYVCIYIYIYIYMYVHISYHTILLLGCFAGVVARRATVFPSARS